MNVNVSSHDVRNPISGCTRDEEIAAAYFIGGRLPFDAWGAQRRRRLKKQRKKNIAHNRRGQERK